MPKSIIALRSWFDNSLKLIRCIFLLPCTLNLSSNYKLYVESAGRKAESFQKTISCLTAYVLVLQSLITFLKGTNYEIAEVFV
jgi:hypothetical protein